MSTRTIEPIHIVLPDADGGYYRFGELPRLIAEALKPDTEEADADPHGDYYVFRALDQMNYEKDLPQAAALPPGAPGYLHVVENSASKRPLEWRMGAVLNAGLVHLDWLNEWGESRKPPLVFSTVAASTPQAATPAPVVAESANNGPLPLTTGDIAFCFDGIRWNEQQWRKPLGDKPKWLQSCVAIPGQRGVSETRWNPVLIAAALVHDGHAQARSIRAKFQTKPLLKDWLEAWKTYEADNFGTQ